MIKHTTNDSLDFIKAEALTENTAMKRHQDRNSRKRKIFYGCKIRKILVKTLAAAAAAAVLFFAAGCSSSDSQAGTSSASDKQLKVYFLDVGQADSTLLVSGDEAMLVDAGNRDDADFLLSYLNELGIDKLKYIVFTHPHEDHIGAGEAVVQNIDVQKVFMLDGYDSGIDLQLREAVESAGIETEAPQPGDTADFGDCTIDFLGPDRDYEDANDDSICLKVIHGSSSFLFTGDAGSTPERAMIDAGYDLEADVLQAGHHGSSTSNSYYFLRESNPKYVVISCGKDNMYGHPHEEAMSRFNDLGAEIFRTDQQGTVIATDDGSEIKFNCEGKKATRKHTADVEEAEYIGNVNSRKYHRADCSSLPEEQNRVYFKSIEGAKKAGYEPCGRCHPDE